MLMGLSETRVRAPSLGHLWAGKEAPARFGLRCRSRRQTRVSHVDAVCSTTEIAEGEVVLTATERRRPRLGTKAAKEPAPDAPPYTESHDP
jgi:hypothetical protein